MNVKEFFANLKRMLWIGCLLSAAPWANAVSYNASDLLLVFRKDGFNDVEFDLGPVSSFLGLSSGTQKAVSFDAALVQANFNNSLADVKFLLVAATGLGAAQPTVWLTDVSASNLATQLTLSKFSAIRSKISAIGQQASILTASNALPAVIATSQPGSFTYVASDANLTPAGSLGGLTGFPVEAANPATLSFYQFQISSASPRPAAPLVGQFALDATGTLTFAAGGGPILNAPTLMGITRKGEMATILFSSVAGLKYQLRFAGTLPGSFRATGNLLTGDGTIQSLTDTSADSIRFYQIQTTR